MEITRPKSSQPIPDHAKKVFSGILFDVYQWEQEMFDGTKATFEKLKRQDSVTIYPVMNNGKILLLEEQQPGKELFIGAPGGRINEGETVISAARRELLEETGYAAEEFVLWDAQHPTPKTDWVVYSFIAKDIHRIGESQLDAGERITLKPVTLEELLHIAGESHFREKEIVPKLLEARYLPQKRAELEELFKPI